MYSNDANDYEYRSSLYSFAYWYHLYFLNLQKVQLNRRFASEQGHEHLDLAAVLVNLRNLAFLLLKRSVGDDDHLAHLKVNLVFCRVGIHSPEKLIHFFFIKRHRKNTRPHETRHARGGPDYIPRIVGHDHVHEDIARVNLFFFLHALAALDFYFLLGWHDDIKNLVLHSQGLYALTEVPNNGVFIPRIGMNPVPVAFFCCLLFCHKCNTNLRINYECRTSRTPRIFVD